MPIPIKIASRFLFMLDAPFSCGVPLANTTMPKERREAKNNLDGGVEKNSDTNEAYYTTETSLCVPDRLLLITARKIFPGPVPKTLFL